MRDQSLNFDLKYVFRETSEICDTSKEERDSEESQETLTALTYTNTSRAQGITIIYVCNPPCNYTKVAPLITMIYMCFYPLPVSSAVHTAVPVQY